MELCQNEFSFANVCTLTFSIIRSVLKLRIHSYSRIWCDMTLLLTTEDSRYVMGSITSH
jgi:hypothetical protein